ncbi:MAG: tetratricopeptide repeat protein [Kiloniellaceae bacterium]
MRVRDSRKAPTVRWAGSAKTCGIAAALLLAVSGCATIAEDSPELSLTPTPELEPAAPGTVDLAQRALAENRYEDARKLLERVLVSDPDNARAKLTLAELRLATGRPKQAAAAFEALVGQPEVRALALQGHGISLMLTGDDEAGYESLRNAVEQDAALWRAWNALGFYHDSRGDWAAAVESYGKALAANPGSALIYNNRGYSMIMQGRLEEAIEDLNKALRLDPELPTVQGNLRLAFAWQGKYAHAMSGVSEKDMGKVLNNIGFIAMLRGDYANAEAYLLRAMEVDPSFNEAASRNLAYLKSMRDIENAEASAAQD